MPSRQIEQPGYFRDPGAVAGSPVRGVGGIQARSGSASIAATMESVRPNPIEYDNFCVVR
ncbi:hypothetical protein COO55_32745 [Rhodococcus opacus]|nr:hypothetical protein COO55_32745 [Rhodococcus opacus]